MKMAFAETDDDYCAVVARLNDRWRVALIRLCDTHAGEIDPVARAILEALPDRFPGRLNNDDPVRLVEAV
jgi:hypothetical protein